MDQIGPKRKPKKKSAEQQDGAGNENCDLENPCPERGLLKEAEHEKILSSELSARKSSEADMVERDVPEVKSSTNKLEDDKEVEEDDTIEVDAVEMFLLVSPILLLTVMIMVCFGGLTRIGYKTYGFLVKAGVGIIGNVTITGGTLGALGCFTYVVFHVLEWYSWPPMFIAVGMVFLTYVFMLAGLAMTSVQPILPTIICCVHYPILMAKVMVLKKQKLCPRQFYVTLSAIYWKLAWFFSLGFLVWMILDGMKWDDTTKAYLRDQLYKEGVFKELGVPSWDTCVSLRNEEDIQGKSESDAVKIRNSCGRIELMGFLIWANPGVLTLVFVGLAKFCSLRAWILMSDQTGKTVKIFCAVGGLIVMGLWVGAGQAGGDMGLSNAFMLFLMVFAIAFVVWTLFAFDSQALLEGVKSSAVAQSVLPMLESDMFKGVMLTMTLQMVFAFIFCEFLARQLQKPCGRRGESKWVTNRGLAFVNRIRSMHWVLLFEWGTKMSIACMVFKVFSVGTPVVLAMLNDFLSSHHLAVVCVIFYFVGITMFLLPPVPGVPVYLAAGSIVVEQMKKETGFIVAVLAASVLCLVLKLSAVVGQQKGIGQGLGKSIAVQMAVGVHKPTIRAIEKILKRPGMSIEKVCILCGGPDWPTSVLTGILGLSCPQMLLGTMPMFFLIIPCVLCGGAFTEPAVKPFSALILMAASGAQGAMGFAALTFISKEQERCAEEFAVPLPEHQLILEKEAEAQKAAAVYKEATKWHLLGSTQKIVLLLALGSVQPLALAAQVKGSMFFRPFALENKISDSFANYGLEGKPTNVFLVPGWGLLGMIVLGGIIFKIYGFVMKPIVKSYKDSMPAVFVETE